MPVYVRVLRCFQTRQCVFAWLPVAGKIWGNVRKTDVGSLLGMACWAVQYVQAQKCAVIGKLIQGICKNRVHRRCACDKMDVQLELGRAEQVIVVTDRGW